MRRAVSQLVHDLRNVLSSADLHLQALGRAPEADPRRKHFLAARRALAEGTKLLDQLTAALPDEESEAHGTPQNPH
jgi:hypothetical protein